MDEKMTSGEIAKKAGVSQKAVRLYDEKGLLKPTEYSEGNYRLYDKEAMAEAGIEVSFIDDVIAGQEKERDEFREMVSKYFAKVDVITLQSSFRYDKADDLILKMKDSYEGQEKFFAKNTDKIKAYFEKKIEEKGEILITYDSHFLHCYI